MKRRSGSVVSLGLSILAALGLVRTAGAWSMGEQSAPATGPSVVGDRGVRVSLDCYGLPLADLLQRLSSQFACTLTSDRRISDQRISLRAESASLEELMNRLARLFSHHPPGRIGYHWKLRGEGAGAAYELSPDELTVAEDRGRIGAARQKVARWLRDLQAVSRIPTSSWPSYRTDLNLAGWDAPEFAPYFTALRSISGQELDRVLAGESVAIDQRLFATELAERRRRWLERMERSRETALKLPGGKDPFPNGIPAPPRDDVRLRLKWENEDGNNPRGSGTWSLQLQGLLDFQVGLEPMGRHGNLSLLKIGEGPEVDLTRVLSDSAISAEQRGDCGFTLSALAKAANLQFCHEYFHKPYGMPHHFGGRSRGIRIRKAPLGTVLETICAEWDLRFERSDGIYYFWSVNWPQDRVADVPERVVRELRTKADRNGGALDLGSRAELARSYTQLQLRQTMELAVPEAGRWPAEVTRALRFYGGLSRDQRRRAGSEGGIPIRSLGSVQLRELLSALSVQQPAFVSSSADRVRVRWITSRSLQPAAGLPPAPGVGYQLELSESGSALAVAVVPPAVAPTGR